MNWNLLFFVLIGCAIMIVAIKIKYRNNFRITEVIGKVIFGAIVAGVLCYFIDQFAVKAAFITLGTMGIIYLSYKLPGLKNL